MPQFLKAQQFLHSSSLISHKFRSLLTFSKLIPSSILPIIPKLESSLTFSQIQKTPSTSTNILRTPGMHGPEGCASCGNLDAIKFLLLIRRPIVLSNWVLEINDVLSESSLFKSE